MFLGHPAPLFHRAGANPVMRCDRSRFRPCRAIAAGSACPVRCAGTLPLPACLWPARGRSVPRYRFAVNGSARYDDPDGTELPDDAAARDYAIRVIRELQHGEGHNWGDGRWRSRRASALCGKSPSRRQSRTMAEAPILMLGTVASRRLLRRKDLMPLYVLLSVTLPMPTWMTIRPAWNCRTTLLRGVRCKSHAWTGAAPGR
jgi:hypothetical protein